MPPSQALVMIADIMSATTAAILVIGDEILSGKTEEQNARFLIGELRELGVTLRCILTISDDVEEVAAATRDLSTKYHHVFTSGGVGPTHDDVTIVGIARAFQAPIVRHPELEARLRSYFGDDLNEARLRMADVPEGAALIQAEDLKWPVLAVRNVYVLPGVPDLFRRKFAAIRERFRAVLLARGLHARRRIRHRHAVADRRGESPACGHRFLPELRYARIPRQTHARSEGQRRPRSRVGRPPQSIGRSARGQARVARRPLSFVRWL